MIIPPSNGGKFCFYGNCFRRVYTYYTSKICSPSLWEYTSSWKDFPLSIRIIFFLFTWFQNKIKLLFLRIAKEDLQEMRPTGEPGSLQLSWESSNTFLKWLLGTHGLSLCGYFSQTLYFPASSSCVLCLGCCYAK